MRLRDVGGEAAVRLAIDAVLLAQRTPELLFSMSDTQSCKDFTKWSNQIKRHEAIF